VCTLEFHDNLKQLKHGPTFDFLLCSKSSVIIVKETAKLMKKGPTKELHQPGEKMNYNME
jgi:hypothetical protein